VVEPCSAPGEYRVTYAHDSNPANNAGPLIVTVPGANCDNPPPNGGSGGDDGGPLPVTGPVGWTLAAAGGAAVLAGVVLLLAARRRIRVEA